MPKTPFDSELLSPFYGPLGPERLRDWQWHREPSLVEIRTAAQVAAGGAPPFCGVGGVTPELAAELGEEMGRGRGGGGIANCGGAPGVRTFALYAHRLYVPKDYVGVDPVPLPVIQIEFWIGSAEATSLMQKATWSPVDWTDAGLILQISGVLCNQVQVRMWLDTSDGAKLQQAPRLSVRMHADRIGGSDYAILAGPNVTTLVVGV